jgi:hypothetical protein
VRLAALTAALAALSAASASAKPLTAVARLHGLFTLAGVVTVADGIPGEVAGQPFTRSWAFAAGCAGNACATVTLVRQRGAATDKLILRRRGPGYYVGSGRFYAPLSCADRVYPRGELVPFKITVQITAAAPSGRLAVATRIRASYLNVARTNLTNCVAALGHDAAVYHGHLAGPVPGGSGGTGYGGTGSGGAGTGSRRAPPPTPRR